MNVKDILQYLGVAALGIFAYSFIRNLYSTQESIIEGMENNAYQQKEIEKINKTTESIISMKDMLVKTYSPYKQAVEDYVIAVDDVMPELYIQAIVGMTDGKSYKKSFEKLKELMDMKKVLSEAMEAIDSQ